MSSSNISNKILHWYDNNKRDLPWRKPKNKKQSEYFTLVSEVMLQQTQVSTVVPYFIRFVHEIPNLKILSRVNNKKLLKLWEGLGYYTRAKNLKKTAQLLVSKFKSKIPNDLNSLKKFPGIGDYMIEKINITSAKYVKNSTGQNLQSLKVVIDGLKLSVPIDEANRHYVEIKRQVDAGELTIEEAD